MEQGIHCVRLAWGDNVQEGKREGEYYVAFVVFCFFVLVCVGAQWERCIVGSITTVIHLTVGEEQNARGVRRSPLWNRSFCVTSVASVWCIPGQ